MLHVNSNGSQLRHGRGVTYSRKEQTMSEQQIQKVKVKRLAHVGLWSSDVAAQARFYRQVLGLDLRNTVDSSTDQDIDLENASVFLSLGDEHHSVGLFSDTR